MKYTLLLLICITIFSCQKERIPSTDSILELTKEFEPEAQYRTQLRMAFGKTVANAFANIRFSKYILERSTRTNSKFFDEIVFAMHKDEIVMDGKSLSKVLLEAMSDDVRKLFGEELLVKVLAEDPLVSIKLPDIFFNFKWETDHYAPFVYVKTPLMLEDDVDDFLKYPIYHHSGYQELVKPYIPDFFCVVVKYSEDHMFIDVHDQVNEKGIFLNSIVPQVDKYWEETLAFINNKGIRVEDVSNRMNYVNKKLFNQLFLDLYEKGSYYFQMDNPDCYAGCVIDCAWNLDSIDTTLPDLTYTAEYSIRPEFDGLIYNEQFDMLMVLFILFESVENSHFSMGNRITETYDLDIIYNFELKTKKYKGIDCVALPCININRSFVETDSNPVKINWYILKGDNRSKYHIKMIRMFYDDYVGSLKIENTLYSPSKSYIMYLNSVSNCMMKDVPANNGIIKANFKM